MWFSYQHINPYTHLHGERERERNGGTIISLRIYIFAFHFTDYVKSFCIWLTTVHILCEWGARIPKHPICDPFLGIHLTLTSLDSALQACMRNICPQTYVWHFIWTMTAQFNYEFPFVLAPQRKILRKIILRWKFFLCSSLIIRMAPLFCRLYHTHWMSSSVYVM